MCRHRDARGSAVWRGDGRDHDGHLSARPDPHRHGDENRRRPRGGVRRDPSRRAARPTGIVVERFKTGTPPRIDGRSVDFSRAERQESEIEQFDYSWSHFWPRPRRVNEVTRHPAQLPCWITFLGRGGQRNHSDEHCRVRDVRRRDLVARSAVLPVGRRQDREVSGRRAAPAVSRARGP